MSARPLLRFAIVPLALAAALPAAAAGYPYSAALASSGVVWNEETLARWLSDPEKFIPGQKMGISVSDPKEREDLVAYLKTLSAK